MSSILGGIVELLEPKGITTTQLQAMNLNQRARAHTHIYALF
jgi:hypothetical protein